MNRLLSYNFKAGPVLFAASLMLAGCSAAATDSDGIDRVLPYWSAPEASSESVLRAAREFDIAAQPAPNLASVPARPSISASDRIAALDAELSADLERASELRASGDRPDVAPLSEIAGLEGLAVEAAPDAPTLIDAPAIDLSAPAVQISRSDPVLTDPETGLPPRTGAVPVPPPIIDAPPEPDLAVLPTPEPITAAPPEFGVEDIEPAQVPEPTPIVEPLPIAEPAAIEPAPTLDLAEPPSLNLAPAGGVDLSRGADTEITTAMRTPVAPIPSISERAVPLLVLTLENDQTVGDDARTALTNWLSDTAELPSRLRLVPYSSDALLADEALGRARLISQLLQEEGVARERLILAPPVTAPDPAAVGQVAIFAAP